MSKFAVVLFLVLAVVAQAFVPTSRIAAKPRVAPLHENFFLDIGEPAIWPNVMHPSCCIPDYVI